MVLDFWWPLIQRSRSKYLKPVYLAFNAYIFSRLSGSYFGHWLSMVCRWQQRFRIAVMTWASASEGDVVFKVFLLISSDGHLFIRGEHIFSSWNSFCIHKQFNYWYPFLEMYSYLVYKNPNGKSNLPWNMNWFIIKTGKRLNLATSIVLLRCYALGPIAMIFQIFMLYMYIKE